MSLEKLLANQDGVITRQQALPWLTPDELAARLGKKWRILLAGVYAASMAPPTYRQLLRAALLHGGATARIADANALREYGVPYLPDDPLIRIDVAHDVQRVSRDFVVVRRTTRLPDAIQVRGLPVVPPYRAVCEFVARTPNPRDALAVAAAAVQRRHADISELVAEAHAGPSRGRPRLLRMFAPISAGVRSAPESDFRDLARGCRGLPEPLWNCLIELPNGDRYSPDGLIISSATIHEVEGREYHDPEKIGAAAFDQTLRRRTGLVVSGFTVLANTPTRIGIDGRSVIREFADMHHRHDGRGLPPGVRILRYGPPGTPWAVPSDVTARG